MQISDKHMKKLSTPLVIRDMPIKVTMRYCYTPTRKAIIKRATPPNVGELVEDLGPSYATGGNKKW